MVTEKVLTLISAGKEGKNIEWRRFAIKTSKLEDVEIMEVFTPHKTNDLHQVSVRLHKDPDEKKGWFHFFIYPGDSSSSNVSFEPALHVQLKDLLALLSECRDALIHNFGINAVNEMRWLISK